MQRFITSTYLYMNIRLSLLGLATLCMVGCSSQVEKAGNSEAASTTVTEQSASAEPQVTEDAIKNLVTEQPTEVGTNTNSGNNGKVKKINTQQFIDEIFDYKTNQGNWVYKGKRHAVIDFYADWCGPCKRVAPIMDELAKQYQGQIDFYKINTDEEGELSGSVFGIRSIPSILFIPAKGQPAMYTGAFPKDQYITIIKEQFKIN